MTRSFRISTYGGRSTPMLSITSDRPLAGWLFLKAESAVTVGLTLSGDGLTDSYQEIPCVGIAPIGVVLNGQYTGARLVAESPVGVIVSGNIDGHATFEANSEEPRVGEISQSVPPFQYPQGQIGV